MIGRLLPRRCMAPIAELTTVSSQPVTQRTLLLTHVFVRLPVRYGKRLKGRAGAGLRYVAPVNHGPLQVLTQRG